MIEALEKPARVLIAEAMGRDPETTPASELAYDLNTTTEAVMCACGYGLRDLIARARRIRGFSPANAKRDGLSSELKPERLSSAIY